MRISDWSSDVCSSDLAHHDDLQGLLSVGMLALLEAVALQHLDHLAALVEGAHEGDHDPQVVQAPLVAHLAHGLALESERVCERRLEVAAGTAAADTRVDGKRVG